MKQYVLLFFTIIISQIVCGQNYLEEGDLCFRSGDYACAESKYDILFKNASGSDKQIAEVKLERAKLCGKNLNLANQEYQSKNYRKAIEFYQLVLDSNPKDAFAKSQIEKCKNFIDSRNNTSFSVSKNKLSFTSSGGRENVTVITNSNSYTINLLPFWCTVQKYNDYFVINCAKNNESNSRRDYFNVVSGNKTIRVDIDQQGNTVKRDIYLNVSPKNLNFKSGSESEERTYISTNADLYNVSLVPPWCVINKYKEYITVSCLPNNSEYIRSDWFKITAGDKEVKIYVTQEGKGFKSSEKKVKSKPSRLGSFSNFGVVTGEIARYGILYETGGRRAVGFHMSARSSLTNEEDILNEIVIKNRNEVVLGPNFKIFPRLYLNLGVGYGYYNYLERNDFGGTPSVEMQGYTLSSAGMTFRISRVVSINGGASFMDIEKDIYRPEIFGGITFNLKKK
ncbi:BACON domain-containing protein [Flavobacterium sp.]|uniref:BACON domain-containing protein n=1 Tax=Flavobacterium sp. TaxID=239 RepID=UPI002FDAD535